MLKKGGNKNAHLLSEFVIEERPTAFLIAFMQFFIAWSAEYISMMMLNGQRLVFDVIVNFIAIKVISEIDNIFIEGQTDFILKKITEPEKEEEYWGPKRVYNKIKIGQRGWKDKIAVAFYKLFKLAYNSVYFYFFPYLIIVLNMISRRCDEIYDPTVAIKNG